MRRRLTILLSIVLLLSMVLIAAGCGPAATTAPSSVADTEVPTEAPAAPTATAAAPEVGPAPEENIARIAFYMEPVDLDPSNNFFGDTGLVSVMYETLTFYNPPGSEELIGPRLATSWERNEDATEWTFHLRQGVKFHDGTEMTADAVKSSFERNMLPEMSSSFIYDPVERIEVVDPYTIKFYNKYSAPLHIIFASMYGAYVMCPSAFEGADTTWANLGNGCGTGPYMIESFDPAARVVYDRFDDYWGGWEEGQFTKLVFEILTDAPMREQLLRAGEVDITTDLSFESLPDLEDLPAVNVDIGSAYFNLLAFFNTTKPPMDDPLVRRALAHSFPFEAAAQALYAGYGSRASGWISAGLWGHASDMYIETDMDLAADLLAQAGYSGESLDLELWHYGKQGMKEVGELWKPELAKLGVNLEIREMTPSAFNDIVFNNPESAGDILLGRWWPTYPTPYDWMFMLHHSVMAGTCCNYGHYQNPELDALIDEANIVSGYDLDKAAEMFVQAQELLMEEMPTFAILDVPYPTYLGEDIQGYVYNPAYTAQIFFQDLKRE